MSKRQRITDGDVFQIPVDAEQAAYGQVLPGGDFTHLVVFDGLYRPDAEVDLAEVIKAPVILYAQTLADALKDGSWPIVGNHAVEQDALQQVEFVELEDADQFRVIDYAGNVLRPATREEIERAPFRVITSTRSLQEAVEAWHGRRDWDDWHLDFRPWDERNADRGDEKTRLLRRLRS